MPSSRTTRLYRFGVFEADAATGELRRQGVRLKLNAQPFQVLLMLLERPGELLTREEISRELWPDGTFVDYEHGVNSAMNRIREALGDTASNPRFIETRARRGYRFLAPVEVVPVDIAPSEVAQVEEPIIPTETANPAHESPSPESAETAPPSSPTTRSTILASPPELPKTPYPVVQTLFVLLQLMYLSFYVGALANLPEIEELLAALPRPSSTLTILIVTAAVMIPVRVFVLFSVLFHAPASRAKFLKIWPLLFLVDELWSLAPFLLLHHLNFGLALASTALLVYAPFAQRSLVLMGAAGTNPEGSLHS